MGNNTNPYEGAGAAESGYSLYQDLSGNWDAVSIGIDGTLFGLDALGTVVDPLGALVEAGVGWLLENVSFLREPIEMLTGDPKAIQNVSSQWGGIAGSLDSAKSQYAGTMPANNAWFGPAATAYQKVAKDYQNALSGVAYHVRGMSKATAAMGILVATERGIIFDIIKGFVSRVIEKALIAAASSWFTLGGAIAAFIASVVADALSLASKIGKRLEKLIMSISKAVRQIDLLGDKAREHAKALKNLSEEVGHRAHEAKKSSKAINDALGAHTPAPVQAVEDYGKKMGDSRLGKINDALPDGVPRSTAVEAAKGTKDGKDNLLA